MVAVEKSLSTFFYLEPTKWGWDKSALNALTNWRYRVGGQVGMGKDKAKLFKVQDWIGSYWFLLLRPSLFSQDEMPADFLQTSGKPERTGGYSTVLLPLTGPKLLSPAWAHLAGPAPNSFSCKSFEYIL